jgi:hypothetical protein
MASNKGQGWHGDSAGHSAARKKGGGGKGKKKSLGRDAVTGKPIRTVKMGAPKFSKPRQAKRFRTSYGWAGGKKYGK